MCNKCIICTEYFDNIIIKKSKEHIIPDSLLYNPDNEIFTFDVCEICNRKFGHTTDNEFLNDEIIIMLRLIYKDFMKNKYNPSIKKKKFQKVQINNIPVSLDLEINKYGIHIKSKPFKGNDNKTYIFVKKTESKKKLKNLFKNNINPIVYEQKNKIFNTFYDHVFLKGKPIPFPRIFYKMAIEYISKNFGQAVVLDNRFDIIRDLICYKTNIYNSKIGHTRIMFSDGIEGIDYVTHEIGIKYENKINMWTFYFTLYKTLKYYISIPSGDYSQINDIVRNYKVNINERK